MPEFMTAYVLSTPGEVHVTFSGHMTPCDKRVHESRPKYESKPKDVTCRTCGAYLTFNMDAAKRAALEHVRAARGVSKWSVEGIYDFSTKVAELVAGVAWLVKREHGEWNSNRVFSDFMAGGGWMTDKSPEARLTGSTGLAVLEVLNEHVVIGWRHVINDTVFDLSAHNQIAIVYPWQEKYGEPVRPLFSATYSSENNQGDAWTFKNEKEFQAFCEKYAETRPYLIEPAPKR
ncbi:hypothetical protein ABZ916_25855 [Streptomyces sp. NPDC046853]|uniref:hypothetical protein n=1 Tax=Streptomyces sp. NPDC046853 TaxID=3154920 RepID=UPI0033E0E2DB